MHMYNPPYSRVATLCDGDNSPPVQAILQAGKFGAGALQARKVCRGTLRPEGSVL
jgi:hypothetical protein